MTRAPRILGLMSGTSADGVDAALLELPGWPELSAGGAFPKLPDGVPRGRVVEHHFLPFSRELRDAVLKAMYDESSPAGLTQLHWWLGEVLAEAASTLAKGADLIASHGQTVQHHPKSMPGRGWGRPATLQLGEASVIAERCQKPVVADFRAADIAAGGVGAPLVPFADWALFAEEHKSRVVLNIGGLSNITFLSGLDPAAVMAFDTGPGNCLMDEVAELNGARFDEGGQLAAQGQADGGTLLGWLAHPELHQPPPKATGREVWTFSRLGRPALSLSDLATTATVFTARTVADALRFLPAPTDEVIVAGGGAKNPVLMRELQTALDALPLRTFQDIGWHAHGFNEATREAAAFAFLGYAHAQGWANTLPQTTGARRAVSGGKLTPNPHHPRGPA